VFVPAVAYPWETATPIERKSISPANPPLPWPRNFPFHPPPGIQTSILTSESALGVAFTTTRQNAAKVL
jgi:hypothetical protein